MIIGFPCLFHLLTGWYCPGCGGTRAAIYLLHGQIQMSLKYHPLVLYIVVMTAVEVLSFGLSKLKHQKRLYLGHVEWIAWLGLGIAVVNCIYKNYMLIIKGIDLLS